MAPVLAVWPFRGHRRGVQFALIAARPTPTNTALARALIGGASWLELTPQEALERLGPGDVALGRLDVLGSLDGIDDGLWALGALAARGVTVLNEPAALIATHDKLLTARLLRRHRIPHPATTHLRDGRFGAPALPLPAVLKPRFGSWGREVYRCDDAGSLRRTLELVRERSWFRRHGALVQKLVPPGGYDLRVVVAAGRVVGAAYRIAADGEWRTNVALGAARRPVSCIPSDAAGLAVAAATAAGAALVGVDLLPTTDGGWTVIELNGAVELTAEYSPWADVFAETALLLERLARHAAGEPAHDLAPLRLTA
jgi:RimK family alpha-L-glutamate ligase